MESFDTVLAVKNVVERVCNNETGLPSEVT